jgi:hypothetical protein
MAQCEYESNNAVKSRALISRVVKLLAQHKGPSTPPPPGLAICHLKFGPVTGPETRDAKHNLLPPSKRLTSRRGFKFIILYKGPPRTR